MNGTLTSSNCKYRAPPARPVKADRNRSNKQLLRRDQHDHHALPFDRLSLQNEAPLAPPIEDSRGERADIIWKGINNQDQKDDDNDNVARPDDKRIAVSLFGSQDFQPPKVLPEGASLKVSQTNNNDTHDEEETTESTTSSSADELDCLLERAQQHADEQQRLQTYWNLVYPDEKHPPRNKYASIYKNNSHSSNGGAPNSNILSRNANQRQPPKSCLNKRSRTAAFSQAAATAEPTGASQLLSTPQSGDQNVEYCTVAAASNNSNNNDNCATPRPSPSGASPAHKKSQTATAPSAAGAAATTATTIQFAPSSAVEFHDDAPVHEWRVLEDAAERFPTTERSDDDDECISESTWAALFALEREEQKGNHGNGGDDDDDEDSLDGSLGRLMAPVATTTANNNINMQTFPRQSSDLSLLSEDSERSLNCFSSSTNTAPAVFATFNEGFRMNSDQSLGLSSVASSSSLASEDTATTDGSRQKRSLMMGISSEQKGSRNILMSSWREEEKHKK